MPKFEMLFSIKKTNKYYLVIVRFRTVPKTVELTMPLLLGLDKIVLVLIRDVTFPECF